MVNSSIAMPVSFFNLMTGIDTCITALLFNLAKALCANGSILGLDACPGNLPLIWMFQHLSHLLTCILTQHPLASLMSTSSPGSSPTSQLPHPSLCPCQHPSLASASPWP